jgi:hypothetical protein
MEKNVIFGLIFGNEKFYSTLELFQNPIEEEIKILDSKRQEKKKVMKYKEIEVSHRQE